MLQRYATFGADSDIIFYAVADVCNKSTRRSVVKRKRKKKGKKEEEKKKEKKKR